MGALVAAGGVRRAWSHIAKVPDDHVTASLIEHLEFARDVKTAATVIAEIARAASTDVRRGLAAAATRLLRDGALAPATRALLEPVIGSARIHWMPPFGKPPT